MNGLNLITNEIVEQVSNVLGKAGLFYRCFGRAKSDYSINSKMLKKNYSKDGKKLQDAIGIRVTLYFIDDVEIVKNILKSRFDFIDEEIDEYSEDTFKPTRLNLIFRMDYKMRDEFISVSRSSIDRWECIDKTFELQIRTVFSEGWHEVEHDFRYKNKATWHEQETLSRVMNGIYAALEINDWSIIHIIDKLAYASYINKDWQAMLLNTFRLRLIESNISPLLQDCLNKNPDVAKKLFRSNRSTLLERISHPKMTLPLNSNNVIYLLNHKLINCKEIYDTQPKIVTDILNKCFE